MTPVTLFSNTEAKDLGLHDLIASHPEYKHFDNGQWRIVEIPPQQFPPVNEASVFILMEYHDVDVWDEPDRWLVVTSDGEHPDGYTSFEEAMQVLLTEHGPVLCPLCPDWDTRYPIAPDFFGSPCMIDGTICCETCYNIHLQVSDVLPPEEESCKQLWKTLYSSARAKGYGIYCGYHGEVRDFAITGHVDGWPSVWSADRDGLERASRWLQMQGPALTAEAVLPIRHKLRFNNEEDLQAAKTHLKQWGWGSIQAENALSLLFSTEGELDEGTQAMILQACYCVNYTFNMHEESKEARSLKLIHQNMEGWSEENDDPNLEPDFTDSPDAALL